ncbi:hypothetical protein MCHIJ_11700 [Mycolicibacterium chitae]|nr:hypothetical protein MCHIJ_11700 [Mycolicibacterium chitae]
MFGGQARTDLEERLPVAVGQFVEDRAARGIGQGLEDITHVFHVRQVAACLSTLGGVTMPLYRVEIASTVVPAASAQPWKQPRADC